MIKLIEFIVVPIYHFFAKWRIARMVKRYGYRLTELEWLPKADPNDRAVRITPTNDGFDHGGDDCACDPVITQELSDEGEFMLVQHREMNLNDSPA